MTVDSSSNDKFYFHHPILTPVTGTLIYITLVHLQKEVRSNVKSVPSSLGRGAQGHLGLVTSAVTYALINPNAIFTHPTHYGPPVQVLNATQFHISKAVSLNKETIVTFNHCNFLERTIIHKINASLESECLTDLIDNKTGLLTGTIP